MNISSNEALGKIKNATVALAVMHEIKARQPTAKQPFTILGSGFCINARGVIVTCSHVIEAFMEKGIKEYFDSIPAEEKGKDLQEIPEVRGFVPHALFYIPRLDRRQVHVMAARVEYCISKTDKDLGLVRLHPHAGFAQGYPIVEIEDFKNIHDGLEIATCGFPLGNLLFEQLGTVSSSFSRGIISSIIPTAGAGRTDVTAFQLDLRVTHGNSGGPVFSWATGRVFAVLQGGIRDPYGGFLFSRAESVYPLFDEGTVENILNAQWSNGARIGE